MNETALSFETRLKNELPLYAKHLLRIRTKSGEVKPFVINDAQAYLHKRLEEQLARTGKVRAVILKGRQQGCCLDPSTKVLTADLNWVPLKVLKVGQELVACDEQPAEGRGTGTRRMRTSVVEKIWKTRRPAFRVTFTDGRSVICSAEHRWLARKTNVQPKWRSIGGTVEDGRDGLKVGDMVRSITSAPWGRPDLDDAWFGGMIDGEGSFDFLKRTGADLAVSPRSGPVLDRMLAHCAARGYTRCVVSDDGPRKTKHGQQPVHAISISGMPNLFRLMGLSRPVRFIGARWWEGKRMPDNGWRTITEILPLGTMSLMDIQTSTQTYVAEGLISHNSTYVAARFYHKSTHRFGVRTYIMAHEAEASANLFEMVERYHQHIDPHFRPNTGATNARELIFDKLDSGYKVATAGSKGAGRSSTVQFFHGCLAAGTPVIDGITGDLMPIEMFEVGDTVRTHTGESAPISFISSQQKPCRRITLRGLTKFPLVATAEHRFWTRGGWRELGDIAAGHEIGFPVYTVTSEVEELPFAAPQVVRPQGGGRVENVPATVSLDFNLGRVVGLYLAEGCIKRQSKPPCNIAGAQFAVHEKEVERTVEWLNALGPLTASVTVQPRKDSKTVVVCANGRSIGEFLANLVGERDGKRLPSAWWAFGEGFVRGLVVGYLSGDGSCCGDDRRIRATSIRPAITVGIRDALAALGYGWAGIEYKKERFRASRFERGAYTLSLCGPGVDHLAAELGKPAPLRKRVGAYGGAAVEGGYAWIPVEKMEDAGVKTVFDFEVGHEDHSYCTIHAATHNSEVAFWPNADEHGAGILQGVPTVAGTEIIFESTANGLGNFFHKQWLKAMSGQSEFQAIFIPWFWQKEYTSPVPPGFQVENEEAGYMQAHGLTLEQIAWRRTKIAELGDPKLFMQEYPATPDEAFQTTGIDSFISASAVQKARKQLPGRSVGAVVAGFDPKRDGSDRAAFIYRQGAHAWGLEYDQKRDFTQTLGYLRAKLDAPIPYIERLFIDHGGSGWELGQMLREYGYGDRIRVVNFGSGALADDVYANRRAEMWGAMKGWITDPHHAPTIPDDDKLAADISAPTFKYDSRTRCLLEPKDQMKQRIGVSPDGGDALALTFAEPMIRNHAHSDPMQGNKARVDEHPW